MFEQDQRKETKLMLKEDMMKCTVNKLLNDTQLKIIMARKSIMKIKNQPKLKYNWV